MIYGSVKLVYENSMHGKTFSKKNNQLLTIPSIMKLIWKIKEVLFTHVETPSFSSSHSFGRNVSSTGSRASRLYISWKGVYLLESCRLVLNLCKVNIIYKYINTSIDYAFTCMQIKPHQYNHPNHPAFLHSALSAC